jgi:hypothetical protein
VTHRSSASNQCRCQSSFLCPLCYLF